MKIIKIEHCIDCPNRLAYYKVDGSESRLCNVKDKEIVNEWEIPAWCPLSDYESTKTV